MLELGAPVRIDLAAILDDGVDVAFERQRHHVGGQAVDHRPRLLARTAMRGLDGDRLARLFLPMRGEGRVVFLVKLARRIIGDVEQGRVREGETEPSELDRARDERGQQNISTIGGHVRLRFETEHTLP